MRKPAFAIPFLFLALSLSSQSAHAVSIVYNAILAGSNEVPANLSPGSGVAKFTLDTLANTLKIELTFQNLTAPASAGHIHCCAPLGTNAAVAVPFVGLPNSTSGTYTNTVDMTLASTYAPGFFALYGTAASAEAAVIAGLNTGNTYANLHNSIFPGGEIRGQIATSATPEPSSLLLLGTGLIGIVQTVRRRARIAS